MNLEKAWKAFYRKHQNEAFEKVSEFIDSLHADHEQTQKKRFRKSDFNTTEKANKSRQSWVAKVGQINEFVVIKLLEPFCSQHGVKITHDKDLGKADLPKELCLVRRALLVHYGDYSHLPDADIILYKNLHEQVRILAILSIKNSFRERYTETPYWKLKLLQSETTKHIRVLMITPDKDQEISSKDKPRKARIVMEYELDGVYMTRTDFDPSEKVHPISNLLSDLKKIL